MGPALKWIGGGTLGIMLVFGSAVVSNQALEAMVPPAQKPIAAAAELAPKNDLMTAPKAELQLTAPKPKAEPFTIKRILPIDGPIKYGQWFWDDKSVPQGPLVITVSRCSRAVCVP